MNASYHTSTGAGATAAHGRINITWANRIEEVFDGTMAEAEHALRNFVSGLVRIQYRGGIVEYCNQQSGRAEVCLEYARPVIFSGVRHFVG